MRKYFLKSEIDKISCSNVCDIVEQLLTLQTFLWNWNNETKIKFQKGTENIMKEIDDICRVTPKIDPPVRAVEVNVHLSSILVKETIGRHVSYYTIDFEYHDSCANNQRIAVLAFKVFVNAFIKQVKSMILNAERDKAICILPKIECLNALNVMTSKVTVILKNMLNTFPSESKTEITLFKIDDNVS